MSDHIHLPISSTGYVHVIPLLPIELDRPHILKEFRKQAWALALALARRVIDGQVRVNKPLATQINRALRNLPFQAFYAADYSCSTTESGIVVHHRQAVNPRIRIYSLSHFGDLRHVNMIEAPYLSLMHLPRSETGAHYFSAKDTIVSVPLDDAGIRNMTGKIGKRVRQAYLTGWQTGPDSVEAGTQAVKERSPRRGQAAPATKPRKSKLLPAAAMGGPKKDKPVSHAASAENRFVSVLPVRATGNWRAWRSLFSAETVQKNCNDQEAFLENFYYKLRCKAEKEKHARKMLELKIQRAAIQRSNEAKKVEIAKAKAEHDKAKPCKPNKPELNYIIGVHPRVGGNKPDRQPRRLWTEKPRRPSAEATP